MKICVIGGASAYMASFFAGIIEAGKIFEDAEFILMDINADKLNLMYRLGSSMLLNAGHGAILQMTTNRQKALEGVDFVITTFRPGGLEARHLDESIPPLHGIIGNETIGPGGLFMACRSIPIMIDIASDVERICPEAIIINYTNPTDLVTGAVAKYTNAKIIGICDQHVGELYDLAKLLAIPPSHLRINSFGLNHATWATSIILEDRNILEEIQSIIPSDSLESLNHNLQLSLKLCGLYKLYPSYYLRYYYFSDLIFNESIKMNQTRAEQIIAEMPMIWESYRHAIQHRLNKPIHQRGGSDHGEFVLRVISALINEESHLLNINTLNNGSLPDFSDSCVVEGPARVSKNGIQLLPQPHLPTDIVGLLQMLANYQELAIEATVHRSRNLLLRAMMAHPLVRQLPLSQQLIEDMLTAHKYNMPVFV